jgi:hypothetical protein
MTPALKEWGAVVHALLRGRQTVLLRKGGIHEKRFAVGAERFLLFPTVAHSHADSTRPEHVDLLAPGAQDSEDGFVVVRAAATVAAVIPVERPDEIAALEPFHIWTSESVRATRIDFRPKHLLTALVVDVQELSRPARVVRQAEYAGCLSWVDLNVALPKSRPLPSHLMEIADQVRSLVGAPTDGQPINSSR